MAARKYSARLYKAAIELVIGLVLTHVALTELG